MSDEVDRLAAIAGAEDIRVVDTLPPDDAPAPPDGAAGAAGGSARPGGTGGRGKGGAGGGDVDLACAMLPMTDLGNAERFARRQEGRFLYVAAIGWLWWDGRRWAREGGDERVTRAVHDTVRAIQTEAAAMRESPFDRVVDEKKGVLLSDKLAAWGRASESAAKLKPVPLQAAPYLACGLEDLDRDAWAINVLNGTLVIRRGPGEGDPIRLKPHDPADRITKLCPVVYDPQAACAAYDRFLADVQPEPSMRRFLHQWGGYSLTGDVGEQKLLFLYGKGRNGKSTLVDGWSVVAGDYGETVPIETFLDQGRGRGAGQATPDLAILPGKRMLRTSEPEKGAKLAEALIKLVTGGEPIQARHLNRDYFRFRPSFKLTMSGNYRPDVKGTDDGIWRRMVLVPFEQQIAAEAVDRDLPRKLEEEASGILNRLLDGLRDYLESGMQWPDVVLAATEDYREASDPLGRFLAVATVPEIGARTQAAALHRVFNAWARCSGEAEWSAKGLTRALRDRGLRQVHSSNMYWVDLRLVRSEHDFDDGNPPHPPADDGMLP